MVGHLICSVGGNSPPFDLLSHFQNTNIFQLWTYKTVRLFAHLDQYCLSVKIGCGSNGGLSQLCTHMFSSYGWEICGLPDVGFQLLSSLTIRWPCWLWLMEVGSPTTPLKATGFPSLLLSGDSSGSTWAFKHVLYHWVVSSRGFRRSESQLVLSCTVLV